MQLKGALTVEKDAELRGDVVLGSKPTDTVTINAYSTSMNSLVATGCAATRHPALLVPGSWGKAMRGAVRNKERWERAPYAYPRSWY